MNPLTAFGKAPLALLIAALVSGVAVLAHDAGRAAAKPDLVFAVFSKQHLLDYAQTLPAFEAKHRVKVQLLLMDARALQSRLQAAMAVGADVPDCFEMFTGSLGVYTAGPVQDVQLLDLTQRVRNAGLMQSLVASRFGLWTAHERIWAIPHDVHPMMIAYRKDLFAALGIDPKTIRTWDEFAAVGQRITADLDGDGAADRYLIDLPANGHELFLALLMQAGGRLFDDAGQPQLASATTARVAAWWVRALHGQQRFAYEAGWGQTLSRALTDGLVLCVLAPDWRTRQLETDMPGLAGKFGLMPLPAWDAGGATTSTWGSTGFFITKRCRNPDLAWQLMEHLYLDTSDLGGRFLRSNILPPVREAWTLPELQQTNPYWGMPLGASFAALADGLPSYRTPQLWHVGLDALSKALVDLGQELRRDPGLDLPARVRDRLGEAEREIRTFQARNRFHASP